MADDVEAAEVEPVQGEVKLDLRADAVRARGEDGVAIAVAEPEKAAEGPRVAQDSELRTQDSELLRRPRARLASTR